MQSLKNLFSVKMSSLKKLFTSHSVPYQSHVASCWLGTVVPVQMKTVSKATLEAFAFCAFSAFRPASVSHVPVSCLPDFRKRSFVDVSLNERLASYA